ncbi:hypothetical protein HGM15179_015463, partial [Zosterops borbonicus]
YPAAWCRNSPSENYPRPSSKKRHQCWMGCHVPFLSSSASPSPSSCLPAVPRALKQLLLNHL